jgi:phosphatidylglycerol:prolipoprotein diacylglycerol transferase
MLDPVAIHIFGWNIHWYGIAWAFSFLFLLYVPSHRVKKASFCNQWEEILTNTLLYVMIGGRLGSVFVSSPMKIYNDPLSILKIWEGGMSFWGAALAAIIYIHWYAKKHNIDVTILADAALIHLPVAIGVVRVANFINGELWGRVTDQTWGVYFPKAGPLLRHPSQLYEAFFEGLILWIIVYTVSKIFEKKGVVAVIFMICYGVFRLVIELFFRQPSYDLTQQVSTGVLFSCVFIVYALLVAMRMTMAKKAYQEKG